MSSLDPPHQPLQPTTTSTATGLPDDPTVNHPCYLTPGVSTKSILNHQKASANITDAWTMTSHDPPRRTLAATAASPKNLVPPNNQNQTLGGIILALPAQQKTQAETINLQTSVKKRKTGNKNQGVPPQSNFPRRPKELARDKICRMLMDKSRMEIIHYLSNSEAADG